MSTIQNVVQIKRGPGKPVNGTLYPYELGYDTTNGYIYIGDNTTSPVAQTIRAGRADKLSTARSIHIDLASTSSATFNGTTDITPGVTGILAVGNGGTGRSTLTAGSYLVGNGASVISLKTPAQVLSNIGALGNNGDQTLANGTLTITDIEAVGFGYEYHRTVSGAKHKYRATANENGVIVDYHIDNELANRMVLSSSNTRFNQPVNVSSGGTGKATLTSGSYLVGNGTGAISLKTPAQVLSDIGALGKSGNQTITTGSLTLDGSGHSVVVQRTIDSNLHKAYLFADANKGASVAYYQEGTSVNKMFLGSSKTTFTKPVEVGSGGTGAANAADALSNLGLNNRVYAEQVTASVAGNATGTLTFTGNVEAVLVVFGYSSGSIASCVWNKASSGRAFNYYGYLNGSLTAWQSIVTISGKTVKIKRDGSDTLNYYVTAFCTP